MKKEISKDWWIFPVLYQALKNFAAICFNLLNLLLGGNLPPFGCVCVVVEQNGRFLVVEQSGGRTVFPGGFMRWQESPEQTVIREGEEETGLRLRPTHMLGHFPIISQRFTGMSTLSIAYRAEMVSGELRNSVEGRPYWLEEDALAAKLNPYYRSIYQAYLRQREKIGQTVV